LQSAPLSSDRSLADWLSRLERLHHVSIDMGLERVAAVRDRLGLKPRFPVLTVGGTNGKGSVCAMLEGMLAEAGYRVGLYTSPHLVHFNERIRIAREEVVDAELIAAFERIETARLPDSLTYFEFSTLAAVDMFVQKDVDVAILEVGLGGRLDAVNAFEPDCAVVTTVDLDHMDYLGPDRESIGREKAGIFRSGVPAVCGDEDPPETLTAHAEEIGAPLILMGRDYGFKAEPGQWRFWSSRGKRNGLPHPVLRGAYQIANAATALAALETLTETLPVDMGAIRRGLLEAELAGRFQVLPGRPMVILDVGHNPHAARGLAESLRRLQAGGRILAVFAMLADKDAGAVAATLKDQVDEWLVAGLPGPRGVEARRMRDALLASGIQRPISEHATPALAFEVALRSAGQDDKILVFGSFHTVGAVLQARSEKQTG
jgi:dihydrofolate synthase / folylpolyglutamate synthase